jgi:hypothetical protein
MRKVIKIAELLLVSGKKLSKKDDCSQIAATTLFYRFVRCNKITNLICFRTETGRY